MTFDHEAFVALCKELRVLGACKVEAHGFSATFVPASAAPVQVAPVRPGKTKQRTNEPTTDELRELARQRELGQL